jgi:hypothetical protein
MAKRELEIVWKDPRTLRPHPYHERWGPVESNDAYPRMLADMKANGWGVTEPETITEDNIILAGRTRNQAAVDSKNVPEVPCMIFRPKSPDTAELEIKIQMLRSNNQRHKTERQLLDDMRAAMELQRDLARLRMAHGTDNKTQRAADRVGEMYKVSGKTVTRRLKVLKAIEKAEKAGDQKKAAKLVGLLEAKKFNQALDQVEGKAAAARKQARKVEVPRTLTAHIVAAYSENFEACAKVTIPAEADLVQANIDRMQRDLDAKRAAMGVPGPTPSGGGA